MASAHDRMPLGALRVFEAVARHLSFATAADALNVTPAAVSQQIKTLEEYIQVPLFRRSGRRVEITDEGLELLPAVRDGLERLESALQLIKRQRRTGPLQISLLASFLQMWLLPRIGEFRLAFPDIELRFHTSSELVDFSRTSTHVALRFGQGVYPGLHSEKLLGDWLVPVANAAMIDRYGMLERGSDLGKIPLLESDTESWSIWHKTDEEIAWQSRAPRIDDSAGLLAAAEEGLGFALARWTLVARFVEKGTLRLASHEALPFGSAYYFVCPKSFLSIPKVAQFREWMIAATARFADPPGAPGTLANRDAARGLPGGGSA